MKISGADPDFHRRDLWEAIEAGFYPEWELGIQVFSEADAERFSFDVLDATKIVPACDCVVLAETKDHANWELIGRCVKDLDEDVASALEAAHEEVEEQEDEHLYHSRGYARELWLKSLGLDAVLPPPEERKDVKSAAAAEQAVKDSSAEARS